MGITIPLFHGRMLKIFTWINIPLLSSLTCNRLQYFLSKKPCRCVLITSFKITIDFVQLPLVYADYPFVVRVNDN
jgi:hypothetical protein